jgi:regulator of sirC expression with transglutaminase-like and TPR domain
METEIYESDPFTAKKTNLLASFTSDYRFQKNDELYIHKDNRTTKVRVIDVRVHLQDGGKLTREVLGMKL